MTLFEKGMIVFGANKIFDNCISFYKLKAINQEVHYKF